MKNIARVVVIEIKKNLTFKTLLIFVALAIIVACLTVPFFDMDKLAPAKENESLEHMQEELLRLESRYLSAKAEYENNPDIRTEEKYQVAKYLYENQFLVINNLTANRGNFLFKTGIFIIGIFGLVIVFAGMLVTREYSTKNILTLATSPIRKSYYFIGKFVTMVIFSLIVSIIYFLVLGLLSLKYNVNGDIIYIYQFNNLFMFERAGIFSAILSAMMISWGACVMLGSLTMVIASVIKNIYINIPMTLILLLGMVFLSSIAGQKYDIENYLPYFNTLYFNFWLPSASTVSYYSNPPWLVSILQLSYTAIFLVIGTIIFEKRQVFE